MLEARALTKVFDGRPALQDLNLTVGAGEIYCLLGANGAGKSTTIKLFLDFLTPTSGAALVDGAPSHEDPIAARRRLAYIPEVVNLHGALNAYENLDYFAALAGMPKLSRAGADDAFVRVGLDPAAAGRRVSTYSKGMRQKVGVAIALVRGVSAFLLDEPTSGLDPKASNDFSRLMQTIRADGGSILMATHDLFRAKEDGTRIGIMKEGRLMEELDPADVSHGDLERIYLAHMHG